MVNSQHHQRADRGRRPQGGAGEAVAAQIAIRALFLQNVLDTREADKREFVFLSQLQSQANISRGASGWPNGSFFAAHKLGDGLLEMMEISLTNHLGSAGSTKTQSFRATSNSRPANLCHRIFASWTRRCSRTG